jgi:hypothetical protein
MLCDSLVIPLEACSSFNIIQYLKIQILAYRRTESPSQKSNWLMLHTKIITAYSENLKKTHTQICSVG